jgi:transcriptional regulator with XRE-family HTH domain
VALVTIADRLKALLEREGLSINAVAENAGMERQACWRIVAGKVKNPGVLTLQRIVEAAGATMAEFFAEED